jgi:hypothetical protein
MKKQIWIIAFALVSVLTSCTKQNEIEELFAGKSAKSWKRADFYKLTQRANLPDTIVNQFQLFEDCAKDDVFTYKANRDCYFDEGVTKCSDKAAQSRYTGKWEFSNNYNTLNLKTLVGDARYYDVIELTEDKLVIRQPFTSNIDSIFIYMVYKAQ